MLAGQLTYVVANSFFKVGIDSGLYVTDLLLMKSFICMTLGLPILAFRKENPFTSPAKEDLKILITRGLIAIVSIFCYNFAFHYMPLTHVNVTFMIYPFIACVLAFLINGERVLTCEKVGMVSAFSGICLFTFSKGGQEGNYDNYFLGLGCVLLSTGLYALIVVLIRKLQKVHFSVIQFWEMLILFAFYFTYTLIRSDF
jgi:drug/metabolite transporter (DMT)-like permease